MITQLLMRMKRANVRIFQRAVILTLLTIFLPACTNQADEPPAAETETAQVMLDVERFTTTQD
ncbi:MAG TPA: hypothetical protein VK879_18155, partial [Candidatus Sulfomarinibacteraceae bacterium]|nr:hypothetical protein [Candidatus Sulfomarinibacteraceae bacterium]